MKSLKIYLNPIVRVHDDGDVISIDLSQLPKDILRKSDEEIENYVLDNIDIFPEYQESIAEIRSRILDDAGLHFNSVIDIEDINVNIE